MKVVRLAETVKFSYGQKRLHTRSKVCRPVSPKNRTAISSELPKSELG